MGDRPDSSQHMKMSHHAYIRSVWNGLSFRPDNRCSQSIARHVTAQNKRVGEQAIRWTEEQVNR